MKRESEFKPPWWLKNRHLQTFWAPLTQKIPIPELHRERVELQDGDFIDIDWVNPNRDAPTVVLLHGLEGDMNSQYLRRMLFKVQQKRWRCALVFWRGCSEDINRIDKTYHAGCSDDLDEILNHIHATKAPYPLFAAGYSLGANVLLKWLGEQGDSANVQAATAVSAPFDMGACADAIDRGFSKVYKHYLLASLKRRILRKLSPEDLLKKLNMMPKDVMLIGSFREFDNRITARLNNYVDADDYYKKVSSINYLQSITKPVMILHAKDDPFMSPDIIPTDDELSDSMELRVSNRGGHVGFVADAPIGEASFYLEDTILEYFERFLD